MILLSKLPISVATLLTFASPLSAFEGDSSSSSSGHNRHRRLVAPNANIQAVLNAEKAKNPNSKVHLKLQASVAGSDDIQEYDVVEITPAVTDQTTISSSPGGLETYVNTAELAEILVSDSEDKIIILAVEPDGSTQGVIADKSGGGTSKHFSQAKGNGKKAFVEPAEDFTPAPWACGFGADSTPNVGEEEDSRRHLMEEDHHDHDDHDHDHHHDHHHSHGEDDSSYHLHSENTMEALADVQRSLRGSSMRLGKRRRLQAGGMYNYQVDIYVEIDQQLCIDTGDDCANNGGQPGSIVINYVNALFAGANTIYEPEVDTHLNVLHIAYTTIYDGAGSSSNALSIMRTNYARGYSSPWWYTSPSGDEPDLHHLLSGQSLGGGVAYLSALCRPDYGFGVSGSMNGGYQNMGNSVVWDMMVFAHELGHNFGTGHTHDGGYTPIIDSCGCAYSGGYCTDNCIFDGAGQCTSSCPPGLTSESATIMSYCHVCSGGNSNQKYTFGGTYVGSGLRSDVNSYTNTPLSGSISYEARRVNVEMFNHVSNPHRADCTAAPPQCFQDADCSDGNDCNGIETCNLSTNSCELGTPQSNCCGNNVCEAGEDYLSCPTDGCVFDCGGAGCQEFVTTWAGGSGSLGNFFKIQALKPIVITGLTKMHANAAGLRTVRVYEKAGDYVGFESNSGSWNSVWSNVVTVDSGGGQAELPRFDAPIILDTGEFHSFHIYDTIGVRYTPGTGGEGALYNSNADIAFFEGKGAGCEWCGSFSPRVFNGMIEYSVNSGAPPTTPLPTNAPTNPPTFPIQVPVVLQCGTSHSDDTSNYAPAGMPSCITTTGTGGGRWYEVTGATAGQTVTLTTCGQATYDTKISVWDDKDNTATCITGNDDACGVQSTVTYTSDGTPDDALVHGFGANQGSYTVSVTCTEPPTPPPTPSPTTANPTPNPTTANPTTANPTTANPTPAPTTPNPTANPTTANPTAFPTLPPTPAPTTAQPTNAPTTAAPTPNPTSAAPTNEPTPAPTNPPTPAPTNFPTNPPTPAPTPAPTNEPTPAPSNPPTPPPTNFPTNPPTPAPTNTPTPPPTNFPTNFPTPAPTNEPTVPFTCSSVTSKGECQNYPNLCEWVGNPNTGSCNDLGGGGPSPTPPPTNGGGGGGDCTAYGDKDTCESAGCSWGGGKNKSCS